jgi:hypothetical protein
MAAWWSLQLVVLVAAGVGEWAVRHAAPGANRWMRGLLLCAVVLLSIPWPTGVDAPLERLVPLQAAIARVGPVVDAAPVVELRRVATSAPAVGLASLLAGLVAAMVALQLGWRWHLARRALVLHRIGAVTVAVGPVPTPCVFWLGRVFVLLDPETAAEPADRLLAVRHELQHVRHRDVWFAWLWVAMVAVCAPNPFAWRLARQLAELDEQAVDAALVRRPDVSPRAYARLLLAAASRSPTLTVAVGLAHTHPLHRRIAMLARPRPSRRLPWLVAAALLLGSASVAAPVVTPACVTSADLVAPDHRTVVEARAKLDRARFIERALTRRPAHGDMIRERLRAAGLPLALEAVALVESGYDDQFYVEIPRHGSGAGLWSFIPATAREYGLRVDETVDERLDPTKETTAAIALLSDLHARYGDWALALAAYNQGPQAVDRAIQLHGTRDVATLVERGGLNTYVPMVWAAMDALQSSCTVE